MPVFVFALILSAGLMTPFNLVMLSSKTWEELSYPKNLSMIYSCSLRYVHIRSDFIRKNNLRTIQVRAFVNNTCKGESK